MGSTGYREFFSTATANEPFAYQRELAETTPSVLDVPTGCGKTQALICAWLYQARAGHAPRRLVYALPLRSLVEQTQSVATSIRTRLDITPEELPIHVIRGGDVPTDWRLEPERPQIIIGTIDMLLSRALNRGYAENRFVWPVSFGLLNNDCRWVFDEIQLMGPARSTSVQLDGLRSKLGSLLPCETVWASATVDEIVLTSVDRPALGEVLQLPEEDRTGALGPRVRARKRLERVDLAAELSAKLPARIATEVIGRHQPGSRTIVVVNTVNTAQQVAKAAIKQLAKTEQAPDLVLIHSRYRPPDRAARMERALAEPADGGTIVVATQVIEAGVDLTSNLLATETAPFSSIVQRLGRCNRYGELEAGTVLWLDTGEFTGPTAAKRSAPYDPTDLEASRKALTSLDGQSVGPDDLGRLDVPEKRQDWEVLRRRDLLELFDTAPDLSGLDVDVGRFIREDDDRSVLVFFRPIAEPSAREIATSEQPQPLRDEIVPAPIVDVRKLLGDGRKAWMYSHLEGCWQTITGSELVPGRTVLLDAVEGGYDEIGWNRKARGPVEPVPAPETPDSGDRGARLEGAGDDPDSVGDGWESLRDHLAKVHERAAAVVEDVCLTASSPELAAAVVTAAALHDVGKAHPVFQNVLHEIATEDGRSDLDGVLLAKSPRRGPPYERRYFRHELASAMAVRADPKLVTDSQTLIEYLIAAHHGRVRMAIRSLPDESGPEPAPDAELDGPITSAKFALGVWDGDSLPSVDTPLGTVEPCEIDLACMEIGADRPWTGEAISLRDDQAMGPFRLAYLEALLRISDWRGSADA